jgi:hypothetical protein
MINLDDVRDGIKGLGRAAGLGLSGGMITEYALEHRRWAASEYEPFWAAVALRPAVEPAYRYAASANRERSSRDRGGVPDDNAPSLPRTTHRGSPAATPPASAILTWCG